MGSASQLELSRCLWCLGAWPTKLERLRTGRSDTYSIALLILFTPLGAKMGSDVVRRNTLWQLCCRSECQDSTIEVEGEHEQWRSPVPPTLEKSHSSWRAPVAPQLSLYGLSLSFVVQKVVLCRSNLYVGYLCWVVLAGWLESDRR